jgi:hypothetical protein
MNKQGEYPLSEFDLLDWQRVCLKLSITLRIVPVGQYTEEPGLHLTDPGEYGLKDAIAESVKAKHTTLWVHHTKQVGVNQFGDRGNDDEKF